MNSLGSKVAPIFFIIMICIAVGLFLMNKDIQIKRQKQQNVTIIFNGKAREIPGDGQLLIISKSLEDTIIVEPATDDDCMRILESHGKG